MPFPTMKVIPDGWSEHHRPVAEGWFTAKCRINGPGTDAVWPDTGTIDGPTIYEGPCSAQALLSGEQKDTAGETVFERGYMVSIPIGVSLDAGGPVVTFTECDDDPSLIGAQMTVQDVQAGSTNWTRDLICTLGTGGARV